MDVLSHAFIPYAVLTHFGRPQRERIAAAVGGFAPDTDLLGTWVTRVGPEFYPLAHRGFSHTLIGAPLLALAVWFVLTRRPLRARWWRLKGLEFDRTILVPLLLGAWSHLLLDMLTITGVPLLWPFDLRRLSLNWFFFSVPYMLIVSLYAWIPVWRRRATDVFVRRWLAVLLLVLFAAGGIRLATYPAAVNGDAHVTPGTLDWRWFVSQRNATGVRVSEHGWGAQASPSFYPEANRTIAATAVQSCEDLEDHKGWRWRLWGVPVVEANGTSDGGWNITFRDSVRLHLQEAGGPTTWRTLFGRMRESGFACRVEADGSARALHRPTGFWG